MIGKSLAQRFDRAQALRQQQRCAGLQPVHAGGHGYGRRFDRFVERGQIERELNDGELEVCQSCGHVMMRLDLVRERGGTAKQLQVQCASDEYHFLDRAFYGFLPQNVALPPARSGIVPNAASAP